MNWKTMLAFARRSVICAMLLPAATLFATTTSSGVPRGILLDGYVVAGATPGSNGPSWETDEVFQGYQGAVNWYVTWDDDHLYLGRDGGNNLEGSVLYLQAEYPGATFASPGFTYENLLPGTAPMGGVNFAAYFKSSYDEFRTYNGSWSAANTSLAPMFTSQTVGDNLEVAIPWSQITHGNGIPTTIRFVLYQVTATNVNCPQEFVYGESPWGTGNLNDGPSVAVNDGTPTSPRQPGGCNVGDSTAYRWWGCYPVVGNISANAWAFSSSQMALDSTVCPGAVLPLEAAGTNGAGTWTQLSAPPGAPPVAIANPSLPVTTVSNVNAVGQYVFLFTGNGLACFTSWDTVRFTVLPMPGIAASSVDTSLCPVMGFSATLAGNPSTVDWDLGNGVHLATANATFDYSAWGNGSYPYQLVVTGDCGSDTVQGVVEINCLVGLPESLSNAILIHPQPSQGVFEVSMAQHVVDRLTIVDLLGRQVHEMRLPGSMGEKITVNLPTLPAGGYTLRLETDAGWKVAKLVVGR